MAFDPKKYHKEWRNKNRVKVRIDSRNRMSKWRKLHPAAWRKGRLQKQYGISTETYEALHQTQNGLCAICGEKDRSGIRLTVDHDHITGKVRGLLCRNCNLAVGHVRENANIASQLVNYIVKYKQE